LILLFHVHVVTKDTFENILAEIFVNLHNKITSTAHCESKVKATLQETRFSSRIVTGFLCLPQAVSS